MAFPHGASAEGGRPTILFFPLVDYDLGVVLLFWTGSAPAHFDLLIEQGYERGRPSLLRLRAGSSDQGFRIQVGGKVRPVLGGQLCF